MIVKVKGVRYRWNIGKFIINLIIIGLIFILGSVYFNSLTQAKPATKVLTFTVAHGETLWTLAERIAPDVDPRLTVHEIKNQNHLDGSNLQAGQKLELAVATAD